MTNTRQVQVPAESSPAAATPTGPADVPALDDDDRDAVQLTELRPVEHSRLRAGDPGDDATDGLKALRSFASRRHADELELFAGTGLARKRRADRWRHVGALDHHGKKLRGGSGGSDNVDSDAYEEDVDEDEEEEDDDDDDFGVDDDSEEYLPDKNEAEVYEYHHRDLCSSPDADNVLVIDEDANSEKEVEEEEEEAEQQREEPEVKVLETPVQQPPAKATRGRGRPRKKKRGPGRRPGTKKKPESPAQENRTTGKVGRPRRPRTPDEAEKELQEKINAIIKKNYLMEQENNNIVDRSTTTTTTTTRSEESDEDEDVGPCKRYACLLCEARFKGSGGLRNHYKVVHATGPLFKCDECGKEFPLKERLKLHVRTHTGFKPYQCAECGKSFARGGQLVQHRRTHSQAKPYRCELCAGSFSCAANLALHLKRHSGQKDHKCELCGRGFVRRDALKKHLECLHKDVKSFLCKICNKTFKGHLPQHMRTHARDRPHGCATCGQRFAQKSQLTVHQRTHSGQRPFRCLVCWQAFAHSTALKLHTRRHTGERPFKCAECSAGFTQLPHWKKHMRCIHGRNEPYRCRRCGSFFRIKSELELHERDCQPADDGDEDSSAARYRSVSVEKTRLLLAVLLKRISRQERLDELGFGKRLIDEVLVDSLDSAGKEVARAGRDPAGCSEYEALRRNLAVFLEWTVPREHWLEFRRLKKSPEEVLEALTDT